MCLTTIPKRKNLNERKKTQRRKRIKRTRSLVIAIAYAYFSLFILYGFFFSFFLKNQREKNYTTNEVFGIEEVHANTITTLNIIIIVF